MKTEYHLWCMKAPYRSMFPLTEQGYNSWEEAIVLWRKEEPK